MEAGQELYDSSSLVLGRALPLPANSASRNSSGRRNSPTKFYNCRLKSFEIVFPSWGVIKDLISSIDRSCRTHTGQASSRRKSFLRNLSLNPKAIQKYVGLGTAKQTPMLERYVVLGSNCGRIIRKSLISGSFGCRQRCRSDFSI